MLFTKRLIFFQGYGIWSLGKLFLGIHSFLFLPSHRGNYPFPEGGTELSQKIALSLWNIE